MFSESEQSGTSNRAVEGKAKYVALFLAVLVVGVTLGIVWHLWQQVNDLEARLARSDRWNEFIERKLHEARRQTTNLRSQAEVAQARAEEAEHQAETTTDALRRTELEREFAREEAERSRVEFERARQRADRMQQEAERFRKQRELELNRMQKALSRIADTVRTPMGMVVNLGEDSFLFDFDKTSLRPENREILSRIAGVLLASHGYRLYVYGHTDDVGPDSYNQNLSERRARAVRDYLVDAGVSSEIIEVKGFGEASPAAAGMTQLDRQKNRRVEIGVIDTVINYSGVMQDAAP